MNIQQYLLKSFKKYNDNNALFTYNKYYTYNQLAELSCKIADTILYIKYIKQPVIIMGSKSFYTHAAICGTIIAGSYYIPLNEIFPLERNMNIIKLSNAKILLLDYTDFAHYDDILNNIHNYNIICPEEHYEYLSSKFTNHNFYTPKDYNNKLLDAEKDDAVYMLYTSGSTGVPKGIKISNLNISSYIQAFIKRNSITNQDKLMQMNDLTFDLSIHSIFLSFICGACLYIPDSNNKINPNKFIISHKITHILMVPSTLAIMKKLRLLKSNVFQSVKYIGFCGETLPFDNAILIAEAAPNAKLENIYGPTEATIACTYFEFTKNTKELPEYAGSMPIGKAYDGMEVFLIDENLNIVNTGIGQIVLSGRQLAKGYVNNETQTKEKFIKINNKDCYLTGDLGRWVNGELVFLGRNDAQVQIRGYRVEIYEIENAISKIENIVSNAVIPTPVNSITYENLTAFITVKDDNIDTYQIKSILSQTLPDYMVPNKYIILDNMPLNSNGKIDRNQLKNMLQ